MKRVISIITFLLCVFTALLAGTFSGFERGTIISGGIYNSHGTGYGLVAECYALLLCASTLLLVRGMARSSRWSLVPLAAAIPVTAFSYYYLVLQKMHTLGLDIGTEAEYTRLMSDAVIYDVLIGVLIIFVVGYEMAQFIRTRSGADLGEPTASDGLRGVRFM